MSQRIQKIENRSDIWSLSHRYKVGDTVSHNGIEWVNLTGKNTEPSVGVDWFLLNEYDLSQITITTAINITTNTTSNGLSQNGRNTIIDNGVNNIDVSVESYNGFLSSYLKHGTGSITFIQGFGRNLIQVDGTNVLSGSIGSTAVISSVGTDDYLRISNA